MLNRTFKTGAGVRRTELVIESAINGDADSTGQVLPEWSEFTRRFGGKARESGDEYQAAMTTQAILDSVYILPYDDKTKRITPRMRVKIGDRILNITSVSDPGDMHEKIVIGCSESVPVTN
jgi:SPP1 family predicted phage head-tail adaptor